MSAEPEKCPSCWSLTKHALFCTLRDADGTHAMHGGDCNTCRHNWHYTAHSTPPAPPPHDWESVAIGEKGFYRWRCKKCGEVRPYPSEQSAFGGPCLVASAPPPQPIDERAEELRDWAWRIACKVGIDHDHIPYLIVELQQFEQARASLERNK